MANKNTFYVTTPIYYPSGKPHIGSAYTTIAADILKRWHMLLGKEVFFLTGTDEHTKKVVKAAEKEKMTPKQYTDFITPLFEGAWKKLNISYDRFIRTSDTDHKKYVQHLLSEVHKKGEIYKGIYDGLYCFECEAYYTEKDCPDKICPIHKKPLDYFKEETYFFQLSKYQSKLLEFYKKNPDFIAPQFRQNEIINRVKEGLKDISISRKNEKWGIPLPFDDSHVAFVWFDALTNYVSGIGIDENKELFNKFWPADIHLVGKDIMWFHTVIWPAMLFAANIEPPKKVFAHGWLLTSELKIGKSSGNAVDLTYLIEKYGADTLRYFLFRTIPFGQDGDFSEDKLSERLNNELANGLGNLLNRTLALIEKNCAGKIPEAKTDPELQKKLKLEEIISEMDSLEMHKAVSEIFSFVDSCNKYIAEKEPWKKTGKELETILYSIADSLRIISILLWPFIPLTSEKIQEQLGLEKKQHTLKECKFNLLKSGTKTKKSEVLFKKIE